MSEDHVIFQTGQAMELVLWLSLPAIIAATISGLIVGLLQALTSIQEQTLPHGFKLVAVAFGIALTLEWFGSEFYEFTLTVFTRFPQLP